MCNHSNTFYDKIKEWDEVEGDNHRYIDADNGDLSQWDYLTKTFDHEPMFDDFDESYLDTDITASVTSARRSPLEWENLLEIPSTTNVRPPSRQQHQQSQVHPSDQEQQTTMNLAISPDLSVYSGDNPLLTQQNNFVILSLPTTSTLLDVAAETPGRDIAHYSNNRRQHGEGGRTISLKIRRVTQQLWKHLFPS
jgi:hypothetical protein